MTQWILLRQSWRLMDRRGRLYGKLNALKLKKT